MKEAKNICKICGGKLVAEFIGNYGTVYPIKANGEIGKRRIRRYLYDESGDEMIYCSECGNSIDAQEFEEMIRQ